MTDDCVDTASVFHRNYLPYGNLTSKTVNKNKVTDIKSLLSNDSNLWSVARVHLEWNNSKIHEYIITKKHLTYVIYDSYIRKRGTTITRLDKSQLLNIYNSYSYFSGEHDAAPITSNCWILPII